MCRTGSSPLSDTSKAAGQGHRHSDLDVLQHIRCTKVPAREPRRKVLTHCPGLARTPRETARRCGVSASADSYGKQTCEDMAKQFCGLLGVLNPEEALKYMLRRADRRHPRHRPWTDGPLITLSI